MDEGSDQGRRQAPHRSSSTCSTRQGTAIRQQTSSEAQIYAFWRTSESSTRNSPTVQTTHRGLLEGSSDQSSPPRQTPSSNDPTSQERELHLLTRCPAAVGARYAYGLKRSATATSSNVSGHHYWRHATASPSTRRQSIISRCCRASACIQGWPTPVLIAELRRFIMERGTSQRVRQTDQEASILAPDRNLATYMGLAVRQTPTFSFKPQCSIGRYHFTLWKPRTSEAPPRGEKQRQQEEAEGK